MPYDRAGGGTDGGRRGSPTASAVLDQETASTLQAALGPVITPDGEPVSDAGRADAGCARTVGVPHEVIDLSTGSQVRANDHIQTANSRHIQFRASRDVASKYLDSNPRWFQQVELLGQPSPRACLAAALSNPWIRFAN